jgi:hypothetical protein
MKEFIAFAILALVTFSTGAALFTPAPAAACTSAQCG